MDKKTVTTISYLSRLKIDPEKEEKITSDLENIIKFVDQLNDAETSVGYAKEMSEEFRQKQAELISQTLSSQDIVICTALIPGKKAPLIICLLYTSPSPRD